MIKFLTTSAAQIMIKFLLFTLMSVILSVSTSDQLLAQPAAAQPEVNCATPQLGTHQQT
jgi:hypothetical protein